MGEAVGLSCFSWDGLSGSALVIDGLDGSALVGVNVLSGFWDCRADCTSFPTNGVWYC